MRSCAFPTKATCLAIYSRVVNARGDLKATLGKWFPWVAAHEDTLRALFASYVEMKQRQNVLDYDDLLLYFAQMLSEPAIAAEIAARFDHLLVDEYQDTNALQGEIVLRLRPLGRGLTVVGDDAQAIYSFRAATVRNILDFPHRLRSACACGDARAQLSFERRHPGRRQCGDCARARALRQDALDRKAAWIPCRSWSLSSTTPIRPASLRPACSPIARPALR